MPEQKETRRMHDRLRLYWQSLKEQRQYPQESEIDPALLADIWDWCFLVDLSNGPVHEGFRYDYMGHELIDAFGMDMTSVERCDEKSEPHIISMLGHFGEIAESGEPATDESEFRNARGELVKYRCCLLPLGVHKVDYILGCMRWKVEP